ncbi:MAG: hypothetical protein DYG93_01780 [Leptolyngbya sp. PLA2]|nr:hypothetical protein [Leptolyngbya sp. PL-A2]MCQ3941054.1 hypothetical protein [cyanobacterium CYA1]MDL1905647.1 hypothetical protein [Synechococcales cyanobacterium CNB]
MPRISPCSRVKTETVWLVSDQSQCRTQTAWSRTVGTQEGTRSGSGRFPRRAAGRRELSGVSCPAMRFDLVDAVLDREPDRVVTLKQVSAAEEYLADHFPTFPVLPGVLMLEAMVQAARLLVSEDEGGPCVLGGVRALKYGRIVQPGDSLRVEVVATARSGDGSAEFKGEARAIGPDGVERGIAAAGRFSLRTVRFAPSKVGG